MGGVAEDNCDFEVAHLGHVEGKMGWLGVGVMAVDNYALEKANMVRLFMRLLAFCDGQHKTKKEG